MGNTLGQDMGDTFCGGASCGRWSWAVSAQHSPRSGTVRRTWRDVRVASSFPSDLQNSTL